LQRHLVLSASLPQELCYTALLPVATFRQMPDISFKADGYAAA